MRFKAIFPEVKARALPFSFSALKLILERHIYLINTVSYGINSGRRNGTIKYTGLKCININMLYLVVVWQSTKTNQSNKTIDTKVNRC